MGQDAARSADDLINTVKRGWSTVSDLMSGGPVRRAFSSKPQVSDRHARDVEYANKSFRDAAAADDKKRAAAKKRVPVRKKTRPGSR